MFCLRNDRNVLLAVFQEIFNRTDLDLSGGISFAEFIVAMHARAQRAKVRGQQIAPYRESFRLFDTQNRGYVTADDAYPILYHELGRELRILCTCTGILKM